MTKTSSGQETAFLRIIRRILKANRPHSPLAIARGAYWFLCTRFFGQPCLKYLDVALDYCCNMKCEHCFAIYSLGTQNGQRLTVEQYRTIAKDAFAVGCLHVNLQGGEPLLMADLEDYVCAFQPDRCHLSVTTNGYLFTTEWAKRLKKSGVRQIVFSLDSLDEKEHDRFRGLLGAYTRVMEGIRIAREMRFAVTVNVTVSHTSLKEKNQRDLFAWLHQERIPYNPILACAVGGWSGQPSLMVTPEDVAFVNSLCTEGCAQRDLHASWVHQGCSATAEQAYITPYGDVIPCPFIQISLGNLHKERLGVIWRRAIQQGLFGRYHPRCWVAEEEGFVKELKNLYSHYSHLPVPSDSSEGREFLVRFWGKKN